MKKIKVGIEGISPLMMHAFPMTEIVGMDKKTAEEQAELSAYRSPTGELFIPAANLQRAFVAGAAYSKGKGRSSLQKQAAACLIVSPERLILSPQKYVIDTRPVVISATKGRILRHRPKFDSWSVGFGIEYDETLIKETEMRRIVDDTGSRVGVLDFRPEKKGQFGRFMVVKWSRAE